MTGHPDQQHAVKHILQSEWPRPKAYLKGALVQVDYPSEFVSSSLTMGCQPAFLVHYSQSGSQSDRGHI